MDQIQERAEIKYSAWAASWAGFEEHWSRRKSREAFARRQSEPFTNQSPRAVFVALGEEMVGHAIAVLF